MRSVESGPFIKEKPKSGIERAVGAVERFYQKLTGQDELIKALKEREKTWEKYLIAQGEKAVARRIKQGKKPDEIAEIVKWFTEIQRSILLFSVRGDSSPTALTFAKDLGVLINGMNKMINNNLKNQQTR